MATHARRQTAYTPDELSLTDMGFEQDLKLLAKDEKVSLVLPNAHCHLAPNLPVVCKVPASTRLALTVLFGAYQLSQLTEASNPYVNKPSTL